MKLYLSSFHLGNDPKRLTNLLTSNKRSAVILNAVDSASERDRKQMLEVELSDLEKIGILPEELDLRDYFDKKERLNEKLKEYGMVWVRGGNTFVLRRAYAYSGFYLLLKEKIKDNDFVYAGYSAGICILSPSLKVLEIVDNPNIIPQGYKQDVIWEGLNFINYAIEPHYRSDHPESADIEKEVQRCIDNKILFVALRDGEVIIDTI